MNPGCKLHQALVVADEPLPLHPCNRHSNMAVINIHRHDLTVSCVRLEKCNARVETSDILCKHEFIMLTKK